MASLSSLLQRFLQPVAFRRTLDDARPVGQAVEQGRRHVRVAGDRRPVAEPKVRRHDDRVAQWEQDYNSPRK